MSDLLIRTAERDISNPGPDFEAHLGHLRSKLLAVLARQDWFVVDSFNWHVENPHLFVDFDLHGRLVAEGKAAVERNDIEALRGVLDQMRTNRITSPKTDEFLAKSNLVEARAVSDAWVPIGHALRRALTRRNSSPLATGGRFGRYAKAVGHFLPTRRCRSFGRTKAW